MVYINSGIGSQMVAMLESTYGVAPTLTGSNLMMFEFISEGLELKKNTTLSKGLHAGGLHGRGPRRKLTSYSAGGPIKMDLPTRYLNQLLMAMVGSKGTAKSALTTDAGGAKTAVHAPAGATGMFGTSLTIQKGVPAVDGSAPLPFTYVGCKMQDWTISIAASAIASLDLNLIARNELGGAGNGDPLNGSVPALATFSEVADNDVFHFRQGAIKTGGTPSTTSGVTTIAGGVAAGNIKSASVKYAMKYDDSRLFIGSNGFIAEPIENDLREISGELEIEWLNSHAMYDAFTADTPTAIELSFTGTTTIGTSDHNTLDILIPLIYLDGESPKIDGPGVVTQKVAFSGLEDGTNNPIQITYVTIDTV